MLQLLVVEAYINLSSLIFLMIRHLDAQTAIPIPFYTTAYHIDALEAERY